MVERPGNDDIHKAFRALRLSIETGRQADRQTDRHMLETYVSAYPHPNGTLGPPARLKLSTVSLLDLPALAT